MEERGIGSGFGCAKILTPSGQPLAVLRATRLSNRRLLKQSLCAIYKKPDTKSGFLYMAEREGFEPSIKFPLYALSRGAPSATRPPLHILFSNLALIIE